MSVSTVYTIVISDLGDLGELGICIRKDVDCSSGVMSAISGSCGLVISLLRNGVMSTYGSSCLVPFCTRRLSGLLARLCSSNNNELRQLVCSGGEYSLLRARVYLDGFSNLFPGAVLVGTQLHFRSLVESTIEPPMDLHKFASFLKSNRVKPLSLSVNESLKVYLVKFSLAAPSHNERAINALDHKFYLLQACECDIMIEHYREIFEVL